MRFQPLPWEQQRLRDLLALQQDNSEPGVQYDTALSSLMQPQNFVMNESTGRQVPITDIYGQPSQSVAMPATNMESVQVDTPYGRGRYMAGDNTRVVLNDSGRIVDLGRDTAKERALTKEDLAMQKARAELAAAKAKPVSEYDKALAKGLAEAEVEKTLAKTPGTPQYERIQKAEQAKTKDAERLKSALEKSDQLLTAANRAIDQTGITSAGAIGQMTGFIGGTPARDLESTIKEIKANIGFERLQQMRNESPTGGALGQVAVQELDMLQSVLGNLDQAQSPEQLRYNLGKVIDHYNKFRMAVGQPSGGSTQPSAPASADSGHKADWIARAKQLNPSMSGAAIEAEYYKKFRRQ